MGQTLSKPVVDKEKAEGGCDSVKYAVASIQGWRTSMEDSHACELNLFQNHKDWYYFGVFDGHSGSFASKMSSTHLHKKIISLYDKYMISLNNSEAKTLQTIPNIPADLPKEVAILVKAIEMGFLDFDDDLKLLPDNQKEEFCSGTTAVVVFVLDDYIIFANCGDSRGVLCRNGSLFFETKDHKPTLPDEKARIEKAGGSVIMDRVNGNLAVSRALGDFSFKTAQNVINIEQPVSPQPTITVIPREPMDQFIVLACDGVWDVMSSPQVVDYVYRNLYITDKYIDIVGDLIDGCLFLNSRDNMTSLLICLPSCPPTNNPEIEKEENIKNLIEKNIKTILEKEQKILSGFAVINRLVKVLEGDKTIGENGIYFRAQYIFDVLDKIDPSRDKSQDYCMSNNASSESSFAAQLFRNYTGGLLQSGIPKTEQ